MMIKDYGQMELYIQFFCILRHAMSATFLHTRGCIPVPSFLCLHSGTLIPDPCHSFDLCTFL